MGIPSRSSFILMTDTLEILIHSDDRESKTISITHLKEGSLTVSGCCPLAHLQNACCVAASSHTILSFPMPMACDATAMAGEMAVAPPPAPFWAQICLRRRRVLMRPWSWASPRCGEMATMQRFARPSGPGVAPSVHPRGAAVAWRSAGSTCQ